MLATRLEAEFEKLFHLNAFLTRQVNDGVEIAVERATKKEFQSSSVGLLQ